MDLSMAGEQQLHQIASLSVVAWAQDWMCSPDVLRHYTCKEHDRRCVICMCVSHLVLSRFGLVLWIIHINIHTHFILYLLSYTAFKCTPALQQPSTCWASVEFEHFQLHISWRRTISFEGLCFWKSNQDKHLTSSSSTPRFSQVVWSFWPGQGRFGGFSSLPSSAIPFGPQKKSGK